MFTIINNSGRNYEITIPQNVAFKANNVNQNTNSYAIPNSTNITFNFQGNQSSFTFTVIDTLNQQKIGIFTYDPLNGITLSQINSAVASANNQPTNQVFTISNSTSYVLNISNMTPNSILFVLNYLGNISSTNCTFVQSSAIRGFSSTIGGESTCQLNFSTNTPESAISLYTNLSNNSPTYIGSISVNPNTSPALTKGNFLSGFTYNLSSEGGTSYNLTIIP